MSEEDNRVIVKIQKALQHTSKDGWPCLIYAHGKSNMQEIKYHLLPHRVQKAIGDRHKAYFYAEIQDDKTFKILTQAPWQDW